MRALLLCLILLLAGGASAESRELQGTDQGNGGDAYALQFVLAARNIARYAEADHSIPRNVKEKFLRAVAKAQVESTTENLFLRGLPKDALNFPDGMRIVFNRFRWDAFAPKEKYALVLHEYLSLIGEEDASYEFSAKILKYVLLGNRPACAFAPGTKEAPKFLAPPRHMNASNYSIGEAYFRELSFALKADNDLIRLEARREGMVIASASAILASNTQISLELTVIAASGEPIKVTCSSRPAR